jgi:hypothetical protein
VTVTAIPKNGYQLTRLAYSYSYSNSGRGISAVGDLSAADSRQDEILDYSRAITTTFTMPAANVYVTAAFGEVTTVNGETSVTKTYNSDNGCSYTVSRVANYGASTTSTDLKNDFPEDDKQANKGTVERAFTDETVKVTVSPGTGFFVRA